MGDPRKPIHRPDEAEQSRLRQIAYDHLLDCTEKGSRALGITGASFAILANAGPTPAQEATLRNLLVDKLQLGLASDQPGSLGEHYLSTTT